MIKKLLFVLIIISVVSLLLFDRKAYRVIEWPDEVCLASGGHIILDETKENKVTCQVK